jgi:asparagine synthase (glutamine-hydrolysing)
MSGFVGIIQHETPVNRDLLATLSRSLEFRGPHGTDMWLEGTAGLGHALLRTGEHEGGIAVSGNLRIVADARLEARQELLDALAASDAPDPELILLAYKRWGRKCLDRLTGDFSFAIWNSEDCTLFCARDQFGVRPFFYCALPHSLIFSNTLESVRTHPDVPRTLCDIALTDFLLFGYSLDSSLTSFETIRRLPAAHWLTWCDGSLRVEPYWRLSLPEPVRFRRVADYLDGFNEHLDRAVAERTPSGAVAILLSGGLDSTSVAAAAARRHNTNLHGFTLVSDRLIPDRERHFTGIAARALGIPVQFLPIDDFRLVDAVAASRHYSEPREYPPTNLMDEHFSQVAGFSTVALTGQGGDAIFAMSPRSGPALLKAGKIAELLHASLLYIRLRGALPRFGFRSLFWTGASPERHEYPGWLNPDLENSLELRDRFRRVHDRAGQGTLGLTRGQALAKLIGPFWPNVFESHDATWTGKPISFRHPLFDLRFMEYCLSLPDLPWFASKTIVRAAAKGRLPDPIRSRPKTRVSEDPTAPLVRESAWLDTWQPEPALERFVVRNRIPEVAGIGGASWWPHTRPFMLNAWIRAHRLD